MIIKQIDDIEFRKALYEGIAGGDSRRRFEFHFSDTLYCMTSTWFKKVMPQSYSEGDFDTILRWMIGKGIHIGIADALMRFQHFKPRTRVKIDESEGNIDFILYHIPYELKSWRYWKKTRTMPPDSAIKQLCRYMAAQNRMKGRIKIIDIVNPAEYTWDIIFENRGELIAHKAEVMSLQNLLKKSLRHYRGWRILPRAPKSAKWICRTCGACKLLDDLQESGLLEEFWKMWWEEGGKKLYE